VFAATRWTRVLAARGETAEAKVALGQLCESYWMPVFRFIAREGRPEETAGDLTQEFFSRILARDPFAAVDPARGRFRSFLLGAVRHFLGDVRDRERAAKRGGGIQPESIEGDESSDEGEAREIADTKADVPDTYFDRQWAFAIVERALDQIQTEMNEAGKAETFAVLKPWLMGDTSVLSQAEAARTLGLGEGAVKVAVHRLRKRFRELVRSEVAQTVPESGDVETELRYLVEVMVRGG
jgi:RNA polymerase sigma-70 factor (ECF subfamily)